MPAYADRSLVVCANPIGCPHSLAEHKGLKGGRCLSAGCPCSKYMRAGGAMVKRAQSKKRKAALRVLYRAPADEPAPDEPAPFQRLGNDPFRRLVLQLGIRAMRDELARLEEELR